MPLLLLLLNSGDLKRELFQRLPKVCPTAYRFGSLVESVSVSRCVIASLILTEVDCFFRVRTKPDVRLPSRHRGSKAVSLCGAYEVVCTSKSPFCMEKMVSIGKISRNSTPGIGQ